jgi:hypothetical protein
MRRNYTGRNSVSTQGKDEQKHEARLFECSSIEEIPFSRYDQRFSRYDLTVAALVEGAESQPRE